MKKELYIKDIKNRDRFSDYFLVREKQVNTGRNGQKYMSLDLVDRTGSINAKVWDNVEMVSSRFETGDIVYISADAQIYNGQLQLRINRIERVPKDSFNLDEFVPSSEVPPEKMLEQLQQLLQLHITDGYIRGLVDKFFENKELVSAFMYMPAGKAIHHVYRGGLLEHTLSMARLAVAICNHYGTRINKDLLLAGVLLHDIGKVRELSGVGAYDYTDEGKLLVHIAIGIEIINDLVSKVPNFPPLYALLLKHMIASHHGVAEFGAIKAPQTMEAMVLSYLDDLDARVQSFTSIFDTMGDEQPWSGYQRIYERYLFDWRRHSKIPSPNNDEEQQVEFSFGAPPPKPKRKRPQKPLKGKLELPEDLLKQFDK